MKETDPIRSPSKKDRIVLQLMIFLAVGNMIYFLRELLSSSNIGYKPFYWILMIGIFYNCLKLLHEWYHYFYITVPDIQKNTGSFTVDVFTTFCKGEPYPMIIETLQAITSITYPHTTYLCDEANDPFLKKICQDLGIKHVTRNDKKDAKAGNINNALKFSKGDLCVVLDPDHVPNPDFLDPIVPHFQNPEVGFVQIVQAYKNLDETLIAKGAAQQTFQFYGPMMMTMNSYGTVLAIGANCTFRRTALESIGGHAAGLAEDMHTSMQLHAKGWKSVYVPSILARGLVPSTLSAYYKQQLKWSRGTFELLFHVFPKLFKKFSWKQKLHYAILPLHYLSGFATLINFIIPVLCLFFNVIPLKVDFETFALIAVPFFTSTIFIRHYVQRWVMEEKERGFHFVGGLLLIGTWWIYILGFVFTVLKKNVPYDPTPKDGNEDNNWRINTPNILVVLVSLFSIIYGLSIDWTPYTMVMAGIAGVNIFIFLFVVFASRQSHFRALRTRYKLVDIPLQQVGRVKRRLWLFRHLLYAGARKAALPAMLIITGLCAITMWKDGSIPSSELIPDNNDFLLSGIFYPKENSGSTSISEVQKLQNQSKGKFDIISLYIPWGHKEHCFLQHTLIDSIYQQNSIPMITWEPWTSLFLNEQQKDISKKEKKVFAGIIEGSFDEYITQFANQIKSLRKPVFLRFAHEPDNPLYPWSFTGNNTPEEFRKGWQYVHQKFTSLHVDNVIWVWNPLKPATAPLYYPGDNYVDWLGVTALNYAFYNEDKKYYSFEELYRPFHQLPIFKSGKPVMIAEFGSLKSAGKQHDWLKTATKTFQKKFPEIKAYVFFNSNIDANIPGEKENNILLDWSFEFPHQIDSLLAIGKNSIDSLTSLQSGFNNPFNNVATDSAIPAAVKGINYFKGYDWYKNYYALTREEINKDFIEIKRLGIKHIKRYGPGVYDKNILKEANKLGFKITYGFYIADNIDFIRDTLNLLHLEKTILQTIENLKDDPAIDAWNIGNSMIATLEKRHHHPFLMYQKDKYLFWVAQLLQKIKTIDPKRRVSVDFEFQVEKTGQLNYYFSLLRADEFGLTINEKISDNAFEKLKFPYFFSYINPAQQPLDSLKTSFYISQWQDLKGKDFISLDGLLDEKRRKKKAHENIMLKISPGQAILLPEVLILRPTVPLNKGERLMYSAMIKDRGVWRLSDKSDLINYEWYLVKLNQNGKALEKIAVGQGEKLFLTIPENYKKFRLQLVGEKQGRITTYLSTLNTPLTKKTIK